MVSLAIIESYNGLIGVGVAVENKNPGLGRFRCHNQIQREDGAAAALVALSPVIRPPVHLLHGIGQESLFGGELGFVVGTVKLTNESLVNIAGLACFKAINGGIADIGALAEQSLVPLNPVVDDAVFTRLVIEEAVDVIHDDHVYIQEKSGAFQVGEAVLCDSKLRENAGPFLFVLISGIGGEWNGINAFIEPGGVIGDADKTERAVKVLLYGAEESVSVSSRVTGAPLQTDDIAGSIFIHDIIRLTLDSLYVKPFQLVSCNKKAHWCKKVHQWAVWGISINLRTAP